MELDSRRQSLVKQLAKFAAMEVPAERMVRASAILDDWDNADFEGKREVVDGLIIKVLATSENIDIQWKNGFCFHNHRIERAFLLHCLQRQHYDLIGELHQPRIGFAPHHLFAHLEKT